MIFKTFEEYIATNKHEKRVWFWPFKWFVCPYALTSNDWTKYDNYLKEKYPVQYFLRETLHSLIYRYIVHPYKKIKNSVKYTLSNPRKEMRKKVFPNYWSDLTETIVIFHLETLIEFVDREEALKNVLYSSNEEHKQFEKGLKECYEYAKVGRESMHKKLNEAYERVSRDLPYEEAYKEVNEIEKQIEECDTKVCEWVIKNRTYFWV
jgi:hypothetical protein